jgi:hypothetical protein
MGVLQLPQVPVKRGMLGGVTAERSRRTGAAAQIPVGPGVRVAGALGVTLGSAAPAKDAKRRRASREIGSTAVLVFIAAPLPPAGLAASSKKSAASLADGSGSLDRREPAH